ncbi:NADPH-dependent oxidoreductase [Dethiothermospora halolimnae]|uniref:NADPH-dependent oxidoreductase n=1 Tax=Dethiothermospora halolimnae TaxID=3114390 RepID=UPI003CCBCE07
MNETINTFLNHRSIRSYKGDDIEEKDLDMIIKSAQRAPSSINGQQVSIIAIKDKERKSKIANLCGDQSWIDEAPVFLLFAMDFYRAKIAAEKNGVDLVITENAESVMVGSVDVGIALGNAIGAAESLGLGVVPIGGVRNNPDEIIKLLELPEYVYPVVGLCVGDPKDNSDIKPRFPKEAIYHKEKYNKDLKDIVDKYDNTMAKYMVERTNGESDRNWSQTVSHVYKTVYFPKVSPILKEQGFQNK